MNVKEAIELLKVWPENAKILALQISIMPDAAVDKVHLITHLARGRPRYPGYRHGRAREAVMKIQCQCCGEEIPDLPDGTTEQQARQALRAVLLWYAVSPIREIEMANAMCGLRFPIREIEAALPVPDNASKHQALKNTGLTEPGDF